MVEKIKVAVDSQREINLIVIVRTDAWANFLMSEVIERCMMYAEASADVVFPAMLWSVEGFRLISGKVDVPLGGIPHQPLFQEVNNGGTSSRENLMRNVNSAELASAGCNLILFPVVSRLFRNSRFNWNGISTKFH